MQTIQIGRSQCSMDNLCERLVHQVRFATDSKYYTEAHFTLIKNCSPHNVQWHLTF